MINPVPTLLKHDRPEPRGMVGDISVRNRLRVLATMAPAILVTVAVAGAQAQPIGAWYGTMSNFGGPRQARVVSGVLTISPSVNPFEAPIAVFGDVRTTGYFPNTDGAQYNLIGQSLGPTYTHPLNLGDTFDGTTDGNWNYTVEVHTGDVYRLDRTWQNPVFLFNVGSSSQGGIAYDCATGTLWVANEGGCQGSGQCGVSGLATNYTLSGTPLGSAIFSPGSALLNDLAIDVDGTFWTHVTFASGDQLVHYDRNGNSLPSFAMNLGGDTIRGAEIGCVPEPAGGTVLLTLGALVSLIANQRRRSM